MSHCFHILTQTRAREEHQNITVLCRSVRSTCNSCHPMPFRNTNEGRMSVCTLNTVHNNQAPPPSGKIQSNVSFVRLDNVRTETRTNKITHTSTSGELWTPSTPRHLRFDDRPGHDRFHFTARKYLNISYRQRNVARVGATAASPQSLNSRSRSISLTS